MSRSTHPRKRNRKQWGIWCESSTGERTWLRGPSGIPDAFHTRTDAAQFIAHTPAVWPEWTYTPRRLS